MTFDNITIFLISIEISTNLFNSYYFLIEFEIFVEEILLFKILLNEKIYK